MDRDRIVAVLNRLYGTTLTADIVQVAVDHGFTSWPLLAQEAGEAQSGDARSAVGKTEPGNALSSQPLCPAAGEGEQEQP